MSIFTAAAQALLPQMQAIVPVSREQQLINLQNGFNKTAEQNRINRRRVAANLRAQQAAAIVDHMRAITGLVSTELMQASGLNSIEINSEMLTFERTVTALATVELGDIHFGPLLDLMEIVLVELTGDLANFDTAFGITRDLMSKYIMPVVNAKGNPEAIIIESNVRPGSRSDANLRDCYELILSKLEDNVYFDGKITKARVQQMRDEFNATGQVNLVSAARDVTEAQSSTTQH